jgi:phosphoserine phosphatase
MMSDDSTSRLTGDDSTGRGLESEVVRLRAVAEAARLVHSSLDLDELLDNILKAAATTVGAVRGTVYVCDHEHRQLWSRVTAGSERVEIRLPFGRGLAGHAAETGEPVCANDVRAHPRFDPNVDRRTGFRTENAVCSPVRDWQGTVSAVVQLLNKPGGFGPADLEFLDLMGAHVAQALANAQAQKVLLERQRLQKEMELAERIQSLLLPAELPRLPGLDLAAHMIPSRQVGGDYYDVVPIGDRTLFVLADVSGKGVAAALVMSNLQAALWATAELGLDLPEWARHLNDVLYNRLGGSRYVTAILLLVEADARRLSYLNAGHPPGLVRSPAGNQRLSATGPPLGLLPEQVYETASLVLDDGGQVLLYSDGLTEASDAAGQEMGVEGLEELLDEVGEVSAGEAAECLLSSVEQYSIDDPDRDDRTLVLLKARSREPA